MSDRLQTLLLKYELLGAARRRRPLCLCLTVQGCPANTEDECRAGQIRSRKQEQASPTVPAARQQQFTLPRRVAALKDEPGHLDGRRIPQHRQQAEPQPDRAARVLKAQPAPAVGVPGVPQAPAPEVQVQGSQLQAASHTQPHRRLACRLAIT